MKVLVCKLHHEIIGITLYTVEAEALDEKFPDIGMEDHIYTLHYGGSKVEVYDRYLVAKPASNAKGWEQMMKRLMSKALTDEWQQNCPEDAVDIWSWRNLFI